ncbi:MAG: hypothetical protein WCF30_19310 [Terracidiphilus sp.]
MKTRIAIWAVAGAIVAAFWALYIMTTHQNLLGGVGGDILCLTCPIALVRHHPVGFYAVLFANAATYALIGAVVETMRRRHQIHSISN